MSARRLIFVIFTCEDCGIESHPFETDSVTQARIALTMNHGWLTERPIWNRTVDLCPDCQESAR